MASAARDMRHSRYAEAIPLFQEAAALARRRSEYDEALYREAKAWKYAGDYGRAVQVLDHMVSLEPTGRRTAKALYEASVIRQNQMGLDQQADEGFDRVIREFPESSGAPSSLQRRLERFEEQGEVQQVFDWIDATYAEVGSSRVGDNLLWAKAELILEHVDDRDAAKAVLQQLVREHPYPQGGLWDDALTRLAELDVEDGEPERAIEYLRILANQAETTHLIILPNNAGSYTLPSMAAAQLEIARIYRDQLSDYEAADREFKRTWRDFPRSGVRDDAMYELGAMWVDQGEVSRGCRWLEETLEEFEVGHGRRLAAERAEADCAGD